MVCLVYYLGCMVVNISALFVEWGITEREVTNFRYCCLGYFLLSMLVMDAFHGFGKYIFPRIHTCTAFSASLLGALVHLT